MKCPVCDKGELAKHPDSNFEGMLECFVCGSIVNGDELHKKANPEPDAS